MRVANSSTRGFTLLELLVAIAIFAVVSTLALTGPLTGTSANRSGRPPISDPDEVARELGADLDLLVDGGTTPGGAPSTIVDATLDPPRMLRAGAYAWTDRPK